jgi:hypothetical protein
MLFVPGPLIVILLDVAVRQISPFFSKLNCLVGVEMLY